MELTHDFTATSASDDAGDDRIPFVLGGLLALVAGIAFVRMMQRRA